MPQQVTIRAPYGSLLKRPRETRPRKNGFGRARQQNPSYLELIRQCPCLKCGLDGFSEAAHVRQNSAAHGKRQALGQKPDDQWSLPLCAGCHRLDDDSQHRLGEETFWHRLGISPLLVCEKLHAAAPDLVRMRAVVVRAIAERGVT